MLNYTVKWNVVDKKPIAEVKPPKIVKKIRFFSKAQVSKLIEEAKEPLKTAIIILVNTGLRQAEIINLRWQDVILSPSKCEFGPMMDLP
jgi:integrase